MNRIVLAFLLGIVCSSSFAQSPMRHDEARESTRQAAQDKDERAKLIRKIVMSWGPFVKAIYGEDIGLWADRLVPAFRQADTVKLRAASRAVTFEGMVNALVGQKTM